VAAHDGRLRAGGWAVHWPVLKLRPTFSVEVLEGLHHRIPLGDAEVQMGSQHESHHAARSGHERLEIYPITDHNIAIGERQIGSDISRCLHSKTRDRMTIIASPPDENGATRVWGLGSRGVRPAHQERRQSHEGPRARVSRVHGSSVQRDV
jgi:hypothetical protein